MAYTLGDLLQLLPIQLFHILPAYEGARLLQGKIGAEFNFYTTPTKPLDGFRRA
jgi:hypothetical protein